MVWQETVRAIEDVAPDDADRILEGTAAHLYRLELALAPPRPFDSGETLGRTAH